MLSQYMDYASFVSERHKYVYIATPKAACTYLKILVARLEGYPLHNPEDFSIKETRRSQFIHWRKEIAIPSLRDVAQTLDVTKPHDYFLFTVVRNPYARFFSAWASKIAEQEPNVVHKLQGRPGFHALTPRSPSDIPPYFENFVEYVYRHEYPAFADDHWQLQARLLAPEQLRYSFIGKMEEMAEVSHRFQEHLAQFGLRLPVIPRVNDSLIKYHPDYITDRSRELLRIMYSEDFEAFGYSNELPQVKEKPAVDFDHLAGICERNERIGYLHGVANQKHEELEQIQNAYEAQQELLHQERAQHVLVSQYLDDTKAHAGRIESSLAEAQAALAKSRQDLDETLEHARRLEGMREAGTVEARNQAGRVQELEQALADTVGERQQLQAALQDWVAETAPRVDEAPTVYIATPTLNARSTLDATILSIVTQPGLFRVRYHVQDGGSTDDTLEILESWRRRLAAPSPLIRCQGVDFSYASEPDAGLYDAIGKAFARLAPPADAFMGWLNSDDLLLGNALSTIALAQHADIEWLGGATYVIDAEDRTLVAGVWDYPREVIKAGGCDGLWWVVLQQEGQFFRKRLWDAAGGFAPGMRLAADWDLWRRFAAFAPMVQAPWPLAAFRKRPGQLSERFRADYQAEVEAAHPAHLRGALMDELQSRGFETLSVQRLRISQGRAEACLQPCTGLSPLFYSGPEGQTLSELAMQSIREVAALQSDLAALQGWGRAEAAPREELQLRMEILRATLNEQRHAWRSSLLLRVLSPLLPAAVKAHFTSSLAPAGAAARAGLPGSRAGGGHDVLPSPLPDAVPPYWDELFARVSASLPHVVVVPCVEQALRTGNLPDRPWVGFLHTFPDSPEAWRVLLGSSTEEIGKLFGARPWRQARASCRGLATFSAHSARYWQDIAGLPIRALPVPVHAHTQKWSSEAFRAEPQKRLWQAGSGPQRRHAIDILDAGGWSRTRICADTRLDSEFHARERQLLLERRIVSAAQLDSARHLNQDEIPADYLLTGVGLAHYYCSCIPATVLRCLESATPVLVNPVASVVECLGHDYPLYYRSYPEAEALLADADIIATAHRRLMKRLESTRDLENAVAEIIAPWK